MPQHLNEAGRGRGMARILILSSWVGHGAVGLSAAAPALQALGHTVTQVPTVVLSNHPGWPHAAGRAVAPEDIAAMLSAIAANGWTEGLDAVLFGYMPSVAHLAVAEGLAARARAAGLRVVVDPILGDAPKGLYLPEDVAARMRDGLVPLADVITPNAFELGWLSGRPVETLAQACAAARGIAPEVLVTSPPLGPGETGVLAVGAELRLYRGAWREGVPRGVGDVFSGLVAAGLAPGVALGHLQALIGESVGLDHLAIAEAAPVWRAAAPVAGEAVDAAAAG
jgi:pyridoxine kinase